MTKKQTITKKRKLSPEKIKKHNDLSEYEAAGIKLKAGEDGSVIPDKPEGFSKREWDLMHVEHFGVKSWDSGMILAIQLAQLSGVGSPSEIIRTNANLSMVRDIAPQDNVEAMLATQMTAVHNVIMECAARIHCDGQTLDGKQLNINSVTKLTRSFVALTNALDKHRGKGQQKMTVEHVHVNEGGQAIIGTVEQKEARKVVEGGAKNGG